MICVGTGRGTHYLWILAVLAAIVINSAGCDSGQAPAQKVGLDPILAMVNDSPITRKDIKALMMATGRDHPASDIDGILARSLIEELVERRLILQRSSEIGEFVEDARVQSLVQLVSRQYGSKEELEKTLHEEKIDLGRWKKSIRETFEIEQVLEREVYSKIDIPEAEILAYYNENREMFRVGKRWRVRQIVVRKEEDAKKLRARIVAGVSFSLLVRQASIGVERSQGGDMGLFSSGELPYKVQKVIQSLKGNEASPVVQTSSGFHLFQVTERRSAGIQSFRAVRKKISTRLLARRGREILKKWIAELKGEAKIRYYWGNLNEDTAG